MERTGITQLETKQKIQREKSDEIYVKATKSSVIERQNFCLSHTAVFLVI